MPDKKDKDTTATTAPPRPSAAANQPGLKVWHLVVVATALVGMVAGTAVGIPKYFTYIEQERIHRAELWAAAHARNLDLLGDRLVESPEYIQLIIADKIEETDLEVYGGAEALPYLRD